MLHFVMPYMRQNRECAIRTEIIFNKIMLSMYIQCFSIVNLYLYLTIYSIFDDSEFTMLYSMEPRAWTTVVKCECIAVQKHISLEKLAR